VELRKPNKLTFNIKAFHLSGKELLWEALAACSARAAEVRSHIFVLFCFETNLICTSFRMKLKSFACKKKSLYD